MHQSYPQLPAIGYEYIRQQLPAMETVGQQPFGFQQHQHQQHQNQYEYQEEQQHLEQPHPFEYSQEAQQPQHSCSYSTTPPMFVNNPQQHVSEPCFPTYPYMMQQPQPLLQHQQLFPATAIVQKIDVTNMKLPSLLPPQLARADDLQIHPVKRRQCSTEENVKNENHLSAEWLPDFSFSVAHGLIVQRAHALTTQQGKERTSHFTKCRAKDENQCIRKVTDAIFDAVLPECWPALKAMIIEANSGVDTVWRAAYSQQPTECIWMRAKIKKDVPPHKHPMNKNDLQRTNMSGRIHGISFQNACLLFIIVRHQPCLGIRFGINDEEGSLRKNDHCPSRPLLLHGGVWVFCANPFHVDTPAIRRNKLDEERRRVGASNATIADQNQLGRFALGALNALFDAVKNRESSSREGNSSSTIFSPQIVLTENSHKKLWKLCNPKANGFDGTKTKAQISEDELTAISNFANKFEYVFAKEGFDISGDCRMEHDWTHTILYYFEVSQVSESNRLFYIGLSDGKIPAAADVDEYFANCPNLLIFPKGVNFCCLSGKLHDFEWPIGAIKPTWTWDNPGDTIGCGLLLSPENNLFILFTANGILMGKPIPISSSAGLLIPTIGVCHISVEVNFGEYAAKPFKFDIDKWAEVSIQQDLNDYNSMTKPIAQYPLPAQIPIESQISQEYNNNNDYNLMLLQQQEEFNPQKTGMSASESALLFSRSVSIQVATGYPKTETHDTINTRFFIDPIPDLDFLVTRRNPGKNLQQQKNNQFLQRQQQPIVQWVESVLQTGTSSQSESPKLQEYCASSSRILESPINCQVCGDVRQLKNGKEPGLAYEAIVCTSCQQFFKRSKDIWGKYECRSTGNCPIKVENRSCQQCRITKCFSVGMKWPPEPKKYKENSDERCQCPVCGQTGSKLGHHYGKLSCEGCKAFFRRESKKIECENCSKCSKNGDMCYSCIRLQKCLNAGMDLKKSNRGRPRNGNANSNNMLKQL